MTPSMLESIDRSVRVVITKDVRERLSLDGASELEVGVDGDTITWHRRRGPLRAS